MQVRPTLLLVRRQFPVAEITATGPGYQVHLADAVRKATAVVTRAVGMIDAPHQADQIVRSGRADVVALARAFLADPRWVWRAAAGARP